MDQDLVTQFKNKYETLAGIVHLVDTEDQAAEAVLDIVRLEQCRQVALGSLPASLSARIDAACSEAGIAVVKPPYQRQQLPQAMHESPVGVTWAALAVAETGALLELTTDDALRLVSALPRVHVGICRARDLLATHREAAAPIRRFFSQNKRNATATFISGPSRTGDIEMRLTLGVHGPEVAHAVVLGRCPDEADTGDKGDRHDAP